MVTSNMMNENEIGYRGSKSDFLKQSVKEQRVDGNLDLDFKKNFKVYKVYSNGQRNLLSNQNPY